MKTQNFVPNQRVRVVESHFLTVRRNQVGRVVCQNFERSEAGYDTFVSWENNVPHESWVPSGNLKPES